MKQQHSEASELQAIQKALENTTIQPEYLLSILNSVQEQLGYIPARQLPVIAEKLNISRAEIQGIVSFYHYYRQTKPGRYVIKVCCAEACQACGVNTLIQQLKDIFGIDFHQTTGDGYATLEPVYCLGNCSLAPSVLVNETIIGKASTQKVLSLLTSKRVHE